MIAKWYPPTDEPLPADSLKAYWIANYTVEVNPLAHFWGSLKTLTRGSIASAINNQRRIVEELKRYIVTTRDQNYTVVNADAVEYKPKRIDLCVIDSPYPGYIKSYAELSFLHKVALDFYDEIVQGDFIKTSFYEIANKELNVRPDYEDTLYKVFLNVVNAMSQDSRTILMYNTTSVKMWVKLFNGAKRAGLFL